MKPAGYCPTLLESQNQIAAVPAFAYACIMAFQSVLEVNCSQLVLSVKCRQPSADACCVGLVVFQLLVGR